MTSVANGRCLGGVGYSTNRSQLWAISEFARQSASICDKTWAGSHSIHSNTMASLTSAPVLAHLVHTQRPRLPGFDSNARDPHDGPPLCRYLPQLVHADAEMHVHIHYKKHSSQGSRAFTLDQYNVSSGRFHVG